MNYDYDSHHLEFPNSNKNKSQKDDLFVTITQ